MLLKTATSLAFATACLTAVATLPAHAQMADTSGAPGTTVLRSPLDYGAASGLRLWAGGWFDSDIGAHEDLMGKLGTAVQPVFIDMDPKRAALVSIPAYMEAFGPSFLGLTGSTDDVERAAKSFKVRLERIQLSHDSNDYVMKHASPIFVMRPSDPHPTPLPATSSPEAIAANLRAAL